MVFYWNSGCILLLETYSIILYSRRLKLKELCPHCVEHVGGEHSFVNIQYVIMTLMRHLFNCDDKRVQYVFRKVLIPMLILS